jgi:transposase
MTVAITRLELSAGELRREAKRCRDAAAARRMLALALVLEGHARAEAARHTGMDRQTLRDWVHRFNADGPDGLADRWASGPQPRLDAAQKAELAAIVEAGPDRAKDGVVGWRRVDLRDWIERRFGVAYHERTVSNLLHELGFSRISARPRHPAQDRVEAFKKTSRARWRQA